MEMQEQEQTIVILKERFNRLIRPLYNEEKYFIWIYNYNYNHYSCEFILFERSNLQYDDVINDKLKNFEHYYSCADLKGKVFFSIENPDKFHICTDEDEEQYEEQRMEIEEERRMEAQEDNANYIFNEDYF